MVCPWPSEEGRFQGHLGMKGVEPGGLWVEAARKVPEGPRQHVAPSDSKSPPGSRWANGNRSVPCEPPCPLLPALDAVPAPACPFHGVTVPLVADRGLITCMNKVTVTSVTFFLTTQVL